MNPSAAAAITGALAACLVAGGVLWIVARAGRSPAPAVSGTSSAESAFPLAAPARTAPAVVSTAAPPAPPSAPPPDEASLMAELRRIATSDPERAVELARQGNQRFPESTDAPERTSILIHALATRGLSSEARGEAERMVNHYPDSAWVREIELFTGAHRHRTARLNDAGQIEFH